MAIEKKARIRAEGKFGNLIREIKKTREETSRLKRGVEKTTSFLGKLAGAYVALRAATGTIGALIDAHRQQEFAVKRVDNAFRSMGRDTGKTLSALKKQAVELQKVGLFGDEQIMAAQAVLATFPKIADEQMGAATQTVVDFAAQTGASLSQAARIVGQASDGLVGSMSRYGISLSDETKKSKDFAAIMGEINSQVAGANKTLGETASGGVVKLGNAWGDFMEVVGKGLVSFFNPAIEAITTGITKITEALDGAIEKVQGWVNWAYEHLGVGEDTSIFSPQAVARGMATAAGGGSRTPRTPKAEKPTETPAAAGPEKGGYEPDLPDADKLRRRMTQRAANDLNKRQEEADAELEIIRGAAEQSIEAEMDKLARLDEMRTTAIQAEQERFALEQEEQRQRLEDSVAAEKEKWDRIAQIQESAAQQKSERDAKARRQEAERERAFTTLSATLMQHRSKKLQSIGRVMNLLDQGRAIAMGIKQAQSVPFPANIAAIATTMTAILRGFSTIQGFADGGFVQGVSRQTDATLVRATHGEMFANEAQQKNLLSAIMNGGGGGGGTTRFEVIDKTRGGIEVREVQRELDEFAAQGSRRVQR